MPEAQRVSRCSSKLSTRPLSPRWRPSHSAHTVHIPKEVFDFCNYEQIALMTHVSFCQSEQSMHRHVRTQPMRIGLFAAVPQVATRKTCRYIANPVCVDEWFELLRLLSARKSKVKSKTVGLQPVFHAFIFTFHTTIHNRSISTVCYSSLLLVVSCNRKTGGKS